MKTQGFSNHRYIGDPINAVKIFNEKEADELMVIDIDATAEGREPDFNLIAKLASECRMPLTYGGGLTSSAQVARIIDLGVEKVAVSSAAIANPALLTDMADTVGSQSIVAVLDVRQKTGFFNTGFEVCTHNATKTYKCDPIDMALELQNAGAGEIVVNSVDCDGMMQGYNLDMAEEFRKALKVPITFLGGAGSLNDIGHLFSRVGVVGAAAGSLFVFKGRFRAVLISYPSPLEKINLCRQSLIK